jgi:hypothetical protein
MRAAAALVACLAVCLAAGAGAWDSSASGGAGAAAAAAAAAANHAADKATPPWLAARSHGSYVVNGDTWHRIAVVPSGDAARRSASGGAADATSASSFASASSSSTEFYFYNERTRATAWELPRAAPRVAPLWDAARRGVGLPLFSIAALTLPDCGADWATILAPAALFLALKHAPAAAEAAAAAAAAAGCGARGALGAVRRARRAAGGCADAPKAD